MRAEVLYDSDSGRSKGCGIVEYATKEEALVASDRLNKTMLRGRELSVREDREDYAMGGAAYGTKMFVGNLSWQVITCYPLTWHSPLLELTVARALSLVRWTGSI